MVRSGAPFPIFDVMKGEAPGMPYPVPWAATEHTSFLKTATETAELLEAAGFAVEIRESQRDFAIGFFRRAFARTAAAGGPPPLGLHLLTGPDTSQKFSNYAAALDARQIDPVIMVARRR